jgi:hypothetical protein
MYFNPPRSWYTYGPSTEPNQVSVAVYAGEIQLVAFDPQGTNPEVAQTGWLAVAAPRGESGSCVIGVTHENAGTVSYVADDMKECRASLADPNDFAGLVKEGATWVAGRCSTGLGARRVATPT